MTTYRIQLTKDEKDIARIDLMSRRDTVRYDHARRGRTFLQSRTKIKVFGKRGRVSSEYGLYPHSSTRQRARYARQMAAGQLNVARLVTETPKKKRASRAKVKADV